MAAPRKIVFFDDPIDGRLTFRKIPVNYTYYQYDPHYRIDNIDDVSAFTCRRELKRRKPHIDFSKYNDNQLGNILWNYMNQGKNKFTYLYFNPYDTLPRFTDVYKMPSHEGFMNVARRFIKNMKMDAVTKFNIGDVEYSVLFDLGIELDHVDDKRFDQVSLGILDKYGNIDKYYGEILVFITVREDNYRPLDEREIELIFKHFTTAVTPSGQKKFIIDNSKEE